MKHEKNAYNHIALILKNLRKNHGWSLDKTAEETGVSKAMLGQIEREESSPTIATLWKIASGFNISFSEFIEDSLHNPKESVYRPRKTKTLHPSDAKMIVAPLFPLDKELNFEIYNIELLPGCEHISPPHQSGVVEHVITIDGTIEVLLNNKWQLLRKGEGLRFNANQPHGYRNTTSEIASFHDIVHY